MAANRLAMNPAKTDVIWCSTSHQQSDSPVTLAGVTVLPSVVVYSLGVVFDSDLSVIHVITWITGVETIKQQSKRVRLAVGHRSAYGRRLSLRPIGPTPALCVS